MNIEFWLCQNKELILKMEPFFLNSLSTSQKSRFEKIRKQLSPEEFNQILKEKLVAFLTLES